MIKSIALAYRKDGITREEYNRYWEKEHAPLAVKMIPGLRRYVQNHFVEVPGMEYQGDGIVEMWYDDVKSYQDSMVFIHSPAGKPLVKDGMKFASMGRGGGLWLVEEHVIINTLK